MRMVMSIKTCLVEHDNQQIEYERCLCVLNVEAGEERVLRLERKFRLIEE